VSACSNGTEHAGTLRRAQVDRNYRSARSVLCGPLRDCGTDRGGARWSDRGESERPRRRSRLMCGTREGDAGLWRARSAV